MELETRRRLVTDSVFGPIGEKTDICVTVPEPIGSLHTRRPQLVGF